MAVRRILYLQVLRTEGFEDSFPAAHVGGGSALGRRRSRADSSRCEGRSEERNGHREVRTAVSYLGRAVLRYRFSSEDTRM